MKPALQLRAAAWMLDLCGVDDAVVGDIIELYRLRRTGWALWREVCAAIATCIVARASAADKPQALRRIATAAAILWLFTFTVAGTEPVNLAASLRVESVATGWFEAGSVNAKTKLVPVVSFRLRNISDDPIGSVQVNVLFRRISESHEWSDVFRRAIPSRGLSPGAITEPIVVRSPTGYTGNSASHALLSHSQFVDTAVSLYARHGSGEWTYLGQYAVPRQVVGGWRVRLPLQEQQEQNDGAVRLK